MIINLNLMHRLSLCSNLKISYRSLAKHRYYRLCIPIIGYAYVCVAYNIYGLRVFAGQLTVTVGLNIASQETCTIGLCIEHKTNRSS